jgi:hypothetical protein
MKKIILFSTMLILFIFSNVQAQTISLTNDDMDKPYNVQLHKKNMQAIKDTMKKAEFIFEGTIIKTSEYQGQSDYLLCSQIVKIKKVFKGTLKKGTVEIIHRNWNPGEVIVKRITIIDPDSNRIFVCRTATEFPYNPQNNIDAVDNAVILKEYASDRYNGLHAIIGKNIIEWYDTTFKSKVALYNYLRTEHNVPIPINTQTYQDSLEFGSEKEILYHHPEIVRWIDSTKRENEKQHHIVLIKMAKDSIESYNSIIIQKQNIENDLSKRKQTTKIFEYHWDAYIRKYVGVIVDHTN